MFTWQFGKPDFGGWEVPLVAVRFTPDPDWVIGEYQRYWLMAVLGGALPGLAQRRSWIW